LLRKRFSIIEPCLELQVTYKAKLDCRILGSVILFWCKLSDIIRQKREFGIWFQFTDLHHETFTIASFALAIGILIGAVIKK
jgi:hypothetical protein